MGGKNSTEVKKIIETELETEIINETTNINNILAETITETTMAVAVNISNKITQNVAGTNLIVAREMIADGPNSLVDLDQQISMETVQKAVIQISSDSQTQAKLANELSQDILNKTKNDSAMQASLQAASDLTSLSKDAGGLEKMVADTMTMMSDMTNSVVGGEISSEQETTIRNTLKASIKNVTINQNDITNIVKNIVNTNITQNTNSTCESNINATNKIILEEDIRATNGGVIKVGQSARVKGLVDCVIKAANTAEITSAIVNEGSLGATTDNENINKSETDGKTDAIIKDEQIQESGLTDFMNNMTPGGILKSGGIPLLISGIVCFCMFILLIAGAIYMSSQSEEE